MPTRNTPVTFEEIISKLVPHDSGCVEWTGKRMPHGYAMTGFQGRGWLIHRLFYTWFIGPIPKGLEIHHSCKNKVCVHIEHLCLVTRNEHVHLDDTFARRNALKTHCPKGHPYEGENLLAGSYRAGPHRKCRTCANERTRKGGAHSTKTHCPKGHPYSGDNLKIEQHKGGTIHRKCWTCLRAREASRWQRRKAQQKPPPPA